VQSSTENGSPPDLTVRNYNARKIIENTEGPGRDIGSPVTKWLANLRLSAALSRWLLDVRSRKACERQFAACRRSGKSRSSSGTFCGSASLFLRNLGRLFRELQALSGPGGEIQLEDRINLPH
jgi:hypothetical protein